jgi:hypothetical protein
MKKWRNGNGKGVRKKFPNKFFFFFFFLRGLTEGTVTAIIKPTVLWHYGQIFSLSGQTEDNVGQSDVWN